MIYRAYFSNIELVKELVAALLFIPISEIISIEFNTINSAIFKNYRNDISVIVNGRLIVQLEHQSAINKNLRIKLLVYKGELIRIFVQVHNIDIHSSKDIIIPDVCNCVLYYGNRMDTDIVTLDTDLNFNPETNQLMTNDKVTIYNISEGFNHDLKKNCTPLRHFTTFLDKTKEYSLKKELTPTQAISNAIQDCLDNHIMEDFLSQNQGKVIKMYETTTNYEEELKLEAKEEGRREAEESARKGLFEMAKSLISNESWPLPKAANFFHLNETETRQLADELGSN
jgi:hypothetical protein